MGETIVFKMQMFFVITLSLRLCCTRLDRHSREGGNLLFVVPISLSPLLYAGVGFFEILYL